MKTNQSNKITFIKKLSLVAGTKQFMGYLFPAFLIISISTLLIVSGVLAEGYLWLEGILLLVSTVITFIIIKHGVDKVWKDMFE